MDDSLRYFWRSPFVGYGYAGSMAHIIITDASPLTGLSVACGLEWLSRLFGEVWMPAQQLLSVWRKNAA